MHRHGQDSTASRDHSFCVCVCVRVCVCVCDVCVCLSSALFLAFFVCPLAVPIDSVAAMDVSADLTELGRTPVAVVCAGVKSLLDIPRTLEYWYCSVYHCLCVFRIAFSLI